MKSSLRKGLLALVVLCSPLSWAKDDATEQVKRELCENMLGFTLRSVDGPTFVFDVSKAIGSRGFLGSYPEATAENMAQSASQGVMYWGHSISVKKTLEEAKAHDAQFTGLSKILYFISSVDVSDLKDDSDATVIRERFAKIFGHDKLIYFDEINGQQVLREVPHDQAQRVIHQGVIGYFTQDDRGPRFSQGGWTFPQIRGVLTYDRVFESGSGTIKKILKLGRNLERQGYQIRFSSDFPQALAKARDQRRIEKKEDGSVQAVLENSRYREEGLFNMMLEGATRGEAFSVEVWNSDNVMVAGMIGQNHGNIWGFDTIFYDLYTDSEGQVKSMIDLSKVAVLAGLLRLHDHGIDVVDGGMVTPFTASLKGVYVPGSEFAGYVEDLIRRPKIEVSRTPFTFHRN